MTDYNETPHTTISLLYVEDEASTREQISRILGAQGYRVIVAVDGEQGLAAFADQNPDIVLTDIMMPRMNGLDMARKIRDLAPDVQIACMTAFSDTSNLIDAINIGIDQFVLKPVDLTNLFTALGRCRKMVELQKRQKVLEAENLQAKKNEAIGILASGMAHDFNNLLQIILGNVSLARMNEIPGSKTDSLLAIAENTSERARELGQRLLTFASGGDAFTIPTALGPLIRQAVETGLNSFPAITAVVNLPDSLPLAMADSEQIRYCFTGLVNNARESMTGGGMLRVAAAPVSLSEENDLGLLPGEYLHIVFSDTGGGISPEIMPRIFDPYFSTKEKGNQKGMGLGLALCYSIIKCHHGLIQAESIPERGASIHIYLPAAHSNN